MFRGTLCDKLVPYFTLVDKIEHVVTVFDSIITPLTNLWHLKTVNLSVYGKYWVRNVNQL